MSGTFWKFTRDKNDDVLSHLTEFYLIDDVDVSDVILAESQHEAAKTYVKALLVGICLLFVLALVVIAIV